MDYGYDRDCVLLHRIDDIVRKASQYATPSSPGNGRPRIRKLKDELDRAFQFKNKSQAKSSFLFFVVVSGGFYFSFSNDREREVHEYLCLRRSSTSSPGRTSSSPRSI